MLNGPKLWGEILALMPEGSIIAGGAVRDYYIGAAPKDIDVFTSYQPFSGWRMPDEFTIDETITQAERAAEYEGEQLIAEITDYLYKDFSVQHIKVVNKTPIEYMHNFDLGIVRCLYDGNLFYTREAIQDHENKTVTLMKSSRNHERSKERAERFIQKNKEYTFIGIDPITIEAFGRAEPIVEGGWGRLPNANGLEVRPAPNRAARRVHLQGRDDIQDFVNPPMVAPRNFWVDNIEVRRVDALPPPL